MLAHDEALVWGLALKIAQFKLNNPLKTFSIIKNFKEDLNIMMKGECYDAVSMITSGSPRLTARPSHGKSLRLGPGSRCKS